MKPGQPDKPHSTYCSYLIRFWYADNAGHPVWRVTIQEPGSEHQLYFDHPARLWAYLDAQLATFATGDTQAIKPSCWAGLSP